jgi:chromate transport protein ChrA
MCGSVGGIVVASILKLLDNIVKEYTGNTANILTAVMCAVLFPDKFEFTVYIMLSMACLFTGIYLYESKKAKTSVASTSSESNEAARESKT